MIGVLLEGGREQTAGTVEEEPLISYRSKPSFLQAQSVTHPSFTPRETQHVLDVLV